MSSSIEPRDFRNRPLPTTLARCSIQDLLILSTRATFGSSRAVFPLSSLLQLYLVVRCRVVEPRLGSPRPRRVEPTCRNAADTVEHV